MSSGARLFFVGSLVLTGGTVFGVNYYIDEEKKRKRAGIFADINRRDEQRRSNMEQYQRQLKLDEQLRLTEK